MACSIPAATRRLMRFYPPTCEVSIMYVAQPLASLLSNIFLSHPLRNSSSAYPPNRPDQSRLSDSRLSPWMICRIRSARDVIVCCSIYPYKLTVVVFIMLPVVLWIALQLSDLSPIFRPFVFYSLLRTSAIIYSLNLHKSVNTSTRPSRVELVYAR